MARPSLIGASTAGTLCGISPQLVRWRANTGKLPVARRHLLRFKLADILEVQERMRQKDPRSWRSRGSR